MSDCAELRLPEKVLQLPIVVGSEGELAVDISKLRSRSGYITLDPGYVNTGSCSSSITFVDGERGILRYRGIPIEALAEHSTFLEVAYLLIHGDLPTQAEASEFEDQIIANMMLDEEMKRIYGAFPRDAHPMGILASMVCALSAFHQGQEGSAEEISEYNRIRLLAKVPTIAAYAFKKSRGEPFLYPRSDKGYCANFLRLMFGSPAEEYHVDPEVARALDILLMLHADHEQNCSTSTVRLVRSAMPNMFATITAAICALWGPRHGGANQHVLEMFEEIRQDGGNVKKYVDRAKDKNNNYRLMGFGHRVYKAMDPRVKIMRSKCRSLLDRAKRDDPYLDIALELEEVALKDPYFIERRLYPNVDFYSGILFRVMGMPTQAFPVMFAIGRLPGWIAHATEYTLQGSGKIGRPRQIYTGPTERSYIPIEER